MSAALGEAALGELELGDVESGVAVRLQPSFATLPLAHTSITAPAASTRVVFRPASSSISVPPAATFAVFYSEVVTSSG